LRGNNLPKIAPGAEPDSTPNNTFDPELITKD